MHDIESIIILIKYLDEIIWVSNEWKSNALGITSIALALLTLINEENRLITALIFSVAIVFYIINSFSNDIDAHEEAITKLKEEVNTQKELISIKTDIEYLKNSIKKGKIK